MPNFFEGLPHGNAVLNHLDDMEWNYIFGYKRVSDLLVGQIKSNNW